MTIEQNKELREKAMLEFKKLNQPSDTFNTTLYTQQRRQSAK